MSDNCMWNAAAFGELEEVRHILETEDYDDIDFVKNGKTPLYIAASWGHYDVVELLIQHQANLNISAESGYTPLRIATVLSENHATKINMKLDAKRRALARAKQYIECHNDFARFFPKWETQKQLLTDQTPGPDENIDELIMYLVHYYNHFATVTKLIEGGAALNNAAALEETLIEAISSQHLPMVKYLVENGANSEMAIDIATSKKCTAIVEYLQSLVKI